MRPRLALVAAKRTKRPAFVFKCLALAPDNETKFPASVSVSRTRFTAFA